MDDVIEFFSGLFSTELWPARWHCGYWSDFHGWLYIMSDLAIWFSYFAIPVIILGYTAKKKYELKYTTTYILFASFILLCGTTHLLDAAMFWSPMYRFNALIRFFTGVISLFTVYHLIQILPDAFRQKTSVVLEKEIAKRLEAEKKLETANQDLEAFAYMASHDLQEPLRKISLFTQQLYEANKTSYDETSKQWSEKTVTAVTRMQKMIADILHLSSLPDDITLEPTDLNAVLEQCKNDLDVKISETDTTITFANLPTVIGHHQYLVQLFTNLISNSIKFSERKPVITITSAIKDEEVLIYFTDNGIGMEQSQTEKIFKPFERLHAVNRFEGTGIGLAICKKIIDIHGGTVKVMSAPDQGSTFSITLASGS